MSGLGRQCIKSQPARFLVPCLKRSWIARLVFVRRSYEDEEIRDSSEWFV